MSVEFATDKERILMGVLAAIARSNMASEDKESHHIGRLIRDAKVGELVICTTGREIHKFTVGYLDEWLEDGSALIRDLASNDLCHVGNEEFHPLVNIERRVNLLWGANHEFRERVIGSWQQYTSACGCSYSHRFGGIEFDGSTAKIAVREAFGGFAPKKPTKPYQVEIPMYVSSTTESIVDALIKNHRKEFEIDQEKIEEMSANEP